MHEAPETTHGFGRALPRSLWSNSAALTAVALLATQFVHEFAHAITGIVVGAESVLLTLFAAFIGPDGLTEGALVAVAVSAPIVNILVGIAALAASRAVAGRAPWWSAALLVAAAFSLLTGFGYAMVDPVTYRPGAPGDLAVLLDAVDGSVAWRVGLFAVGSAGWVATMFVVAIETWRFDHPTVGRTGLATAMLLLSYVLSVALLVPAAVRFHPLGGEGAAILAVQYVLGLSALVWSFLLSTRWLTHRTPAQRVVLPERRDVGLHVAALVSVSVMVLVLTPLTLRG